MPPNSVEFLIIVVIAIMAFVIVAIALAVQQLIILLNMGRLL
jgi:hypothetical protein